MSVKDIDKGYQRFLDSVTSLVNDPYVKTGILGESESEKYEGGFSLVDVASVHEFGSKDGTIPERSFIRSTVDKRRNRILGYAYKMMGLIVDGKLSVGEGLGRVGELLKSNIVQTITDLRTPALRKSTIDAKGSTNPLIDEGRMKGAVNYEVVKK